MIAKKFLIHLETNWCGEWQDYVAIAESETELEGLAGRLAYENFESFDGFNAILGELFGGPDEDTGEYTDEQIEEAEADEESYYSYEITEFSGTEEEWGWYRLIYDCREDKK